MQLKRKQKRFHLEAELLAAIDKCYADSGRKLTQATLLQMEAHELFKDPKRAELGRLKLVEADRLVLAANRLVKIKAPKLGRTLAIMRTKTMPFLDDDSVVMVKS